VNYKSYLFLTLLFFTTAKNIEVYLSKNFVNYKSSLFWIRPHYYLAPIFPTAFVFDTAPYFTNNSVLIKTRDQITFPIAIDDNLLNPLPLHTRALAGHTLVPNQRSTQTLDSSIKIFFCNNFFDLNILNEVKIESVYFYARNKDATLYYSKQISCQ